MEKTKGEIIDWFNRYKGDVRSIESLNSQFEEILQDKSLDPKELALILYHSAKAINDGVYGENKQKAQITVGAHVQKLTSKMTKAINGRISPDIKIDFTIAHTLDAFKLLEIQPPERLTECLQKKATKFMDSFSTKNMVSMLSSTARLALPVDEKFMRAAIKKVDSFNANSYSSPTQPLELLHALAVIDATEEARKDDKRVHLKKTYNKIFGNNTVKQTIIGACADSVSCHRRLIDSLYWFKRKDDYNYPKQVDKATMFEQDVQKTLEQHGADPLETKPHPITGDRIDLKAQFGKKTFYAECDGPTHFLKSADDHNVVLNGHTIFQTQLSILRNPDEPIVRVPIDVYYQNKDNTDLWENFLLEIDDKDGGGYVLSANGSLVPLEKGYNPDITTEDTHEPD